VNAQPPGGQRHETIQDALLRANRIAFGPLMFQAARSLWKRGVLAALHERRDRACTAEDLAAATGLSVYAVRLLLDAGVSLELIRVDDASFRLSKAGFIWLTNETLQVNADWVHDLCWRPFFHFDAAIGSGQPAGLVELGVWPTIYPALTGLPEPARSTWYRFDHHYSDAALPAAVDILLRSGPARIVDVGGNTGRFARAVLERSSTTSVCIVDLPAQLEQARSALGDGVNAGRVEYHAMDVLDTAATFPRGADAIWLSQFLDCFSEEQIVALLRRLGASLDTRGSLFILEPCPDMQSFEAAAHSLNASSLYFACIANGTSRFYPSTDWERMIERAGLALEECTHGLGICHSLFRCRPR
jgi:hypothetical protein